MYVKNSYCCQYVKNSHRERASLAYVHTQLNTTSAYLYADICIVNEILYFESMYSKLFFSSVKDRTAMKKRFTKNLKNSERRKGCLSFSQES